ncbi:hypothetical protein [Streptomyces sp. NPDC005374]|uniref:hypothetical protein n=1 Tax=Streptomyces sp. NPDC005374 TaxID=3364713 RepID=UPI0036796B07
MKSALLLAHEKTLAVEGLPEHPPTDQRDHRSEGQQPQRVAAQRGAVAENAPTGTGTAEMETASSLVRTVGGALS